MMRGGGAKVDTMTDMAAQCHQIQCADIQCLPPFVMKRKTGQCCPTCFAPDHVVGLDRHVAMDGPSPYATEQAPAAPSACAGAKCFKPTCLPGYAAGHAPGACCLSCKLQR